MPFGSKRVVFRPAYIAGAAVVAAAAIAAVAVPAYHDHETRQRWGMFKRYCVDCHNDLDRAGDLTFERLKPESIAAHAKTFEEVIRKLRGRLMPPPDRPQPEQKEIDGLVAWLEGTLDAGAAQRAGYAQAQRLSRTEYASTVKGLLGIDIDPAEFLPTEIEVNGFTNIATGLTVSPAFIDQYISLASTVAHLAVGEPVPKVATAYFPPPTDDQEAYVDGMPLGTRGGIRFKHTFPADGEYRLSVTNLGLGLYPRAIETRHTLIVLVDRKEQFRGAIGGPEDLALTDRGGAPARAKVMSRFENIPLEVAAGAHEIIVTFIERARAVSDEQISTFAPARDFSYTGAPRVPGIVGGINLIGPYEATGLSRTASRSKLFVCEPEVPARERECAERITADFARRAFRRPVAQADLDRLMPFYEEGRKGPGGFDEGIELMVTAVLASPDFLYRTIAPPEARQAHEARGARQETRARQGAAASAAGGAYALSDIELASRLSFFLWSQGPDEELLDLAEAGKLSRPDVLDAEVERMLGDPRAKVLVTNFALPWLGVDDLDAVQPDVNLFKFEFTEDLRKDFSDEIALFLESVLLYDVDVRQLLTADYSFLNERLARHYGIEGVIGPQFRRVMLTDPVRRGLLGKGAVLLRTSYGDRTSPVLRGAWVLRTLMATPPAPPPPGVETNLSAAEGEQPKTVRARLEQHRREPVCQACHAVIDPYGLALENFTVTGRWRDYDKEANAPIDARAVLPGKRTIDGPVELREALLARSDQFVQALTEKLMMYALGRELEYYDMPQVRAVVHDAARKGYRFSAIVAGIVRSDDFRMQAATNDRNTENGGNDAGRDNGGNDAGRDNDGNDAGRDNDGNDDNNSKEPTRLGTATALRADGR
jgi:mono/diheme cytochrome c family protein